LSAVAPQSPAFSIYYGVKMQKTKKKSKKQRTVFYINLHIVQGNRVEKELQLLFSHANMIKKSFFFAASI